MIGTLVEAVAANRTRLRRARNLRAGGRTHGIARPRVRGPAPLRWLTAGCVLLAAAGAALIVVHARWLAAAGETPPGDGAARLTAVLPGVAFTVPDTPGVTMRMHGDAALLILSGMRAGPVQRVDLCDQLADRTRPGRLLPAWPRRATCCWPKAPCRACASTAVPDRRWTCAGTGRPGGSAQPPRLRPAARAG
jgi:hypothetical protein